MFAVAKLSYPVVLVCLLLGWSPARAADEFSFVVIGDTRSAKPAGVSKGLLQARDEINFLKPALVVDIGDLIVGYTKDQELLKREWDEFEKVRAGFAMTCFLAVGNHDVFDKASQQQFMRRYGALWYAFYHGDSRFIILDSELVGQVGKIDGEQLVWLKGELKRHSSKAAHLFVFLHKPLWADAATKEHWFANVHPLLAKHGVEVVFAGHKHVYRRDVVKDGVRYYITGGGGAPLREGPALGGFEHYLWVTVDAKKVDVSVVRTGWLGRDDVVTVEQVRTIRNSLAALRELSRPVPFSTDPVETTVETVLKNEADRPYTVSLSWKAPKQLTVQPHAVSIEVPAGQSKALTATFKGACWPIDFMPAYQVRLDYGGTAHSVEDTIIITRQVDCPFTDTAPKIDGVVDEAVWQKAGLVDRFYNDLSGGSSSWNNKAMVLWDELNLYVAMVLPEPHTDQLVASTTSARDGSLWQDDGVEVFLDPGATAKRVWQLAVNCRGAFKDVADNGDARWNPDWQHAVHVDKDSYSVEMAIPLISMGVPVKPGDVWGANFCRNRQVAPAENSAWCQSRDWRDPSRLGRVRFLAPVKKD